MGNGLVMLLLGGQMVNSMLSRDEMSVCPTDDAIN